MTDPIIDPTIDHETWWKKREKALLERDDFTEYGDPELRTGECFFCGRMYACEC